MLDYFAVQQCTWRDDPDMSDANECPDTVMRVIIQWLLNALSGLHNFFFALNMRSDRSHRLTCSFYFSFLLAEQVSKLCHRNRHVSDVAAFIIKSG